MHPREKAAVSAIRAIADTSTAGTAPAAALLGFLTLLLIGP